MKNISISDIKLRLEFIAKEEGINIDKKSLEYIANNSSWALRNALSLFEQLINDNEIKYSTIVESLGIVQTEILEIFLGKLVSKNNTIINNFDEIISEWKNIKLFFKELIFFTKNKAIFLLKNNEDIINYIKILDILDETYSKTKNSLDENTTFLIWILKIISGYNKGEILEEFPQKISLQKDIKHFEEKKEKEKEINSSDIEDIFSKEEGLESSTEDLQEELTQDFETQLYINILKKNWAKAAILMSIRAATVKLNKTELQIKFKTKFALNSVSNPDTIALLNWWLISMWINNINVKLM